MLAFALGLIIGAFVTVLALGLCVCRRNSDELRHQWEWEEDNGACCRCMRPIDK